MDDLLIGLGLILFVAGIILLIVSFIKKTKKKKALLLVLIGFVVWIIGGAFVDTDVSTDNSAVTPSPTEDVIATSEPTPAAITDAITSEQDAIDAVKKYAKEQGFSETYDKFNATKEENSYFVMAGFSYLGDSWEGSADMYNVYTSTGTVTLCGMADEVLAEKAGEYEDQAVQSYTFNNYYAYDLKITDSGIFGKHITGYLQNNTNQTSNIVVLFRFYDKNNIQIGSENRVIENISPGNTAELSVYGPYDTVKFDIADIRLINVMIYQ